MISKDKRTIHKKLLNIISDHFNQRQLLMQNLIQIDILDENEEINIFNQLNGNQLSGY